MPLVTQQDLKEFLSNNPKLRLLGLDVGTKKIGLALSDKGRILATPQKTITRDKTCFNFLIKLIESEKICGVVVGLPLHMDGKESNMSNHIRQFTMEFLKLYDIPILLADERLSTKQAERFLHFANYSKKKKQNLKDNIAAAHILQIILDQLNNG